MQMPLTQSTPALQVSPSGNRHEPNRHCSPLPQTSPVYGREQVWPAFSSVQSPDAPQCSAFVIGLMQFVPHATCDAEQLGAHVPSVHTKGAAHGMSHSPQCAPLLVGSMHSPEHQSSDVEHAEVHAPSPSQTNPLPHSVPSETRLGWQYSSVVVQAPNSLQRFVINGGGYVVHDVASAQVTTSQ